MLMRYLYNLKQSKNANLAFLEYFHYKLEKIKLEMRLLHVVDYRPRQKIKLDPLSQDDFYISKDMVRQWSKDNMELYELLLQNGMTEFICNRQFLVEFYRNIRFEGQKLEQIDISALKFLNLNVLSLPQNRITTIKNIPTSVKELYLDFNILTSIQVPSGHQLHLLSVSHNSFNDSAVQRIPVCFPELRCLNISSNCLSNLKQLTISMGLLACLKILQTFNNPLSMLAIYYSYITDHLRLAYFDGAKYEKEEIKIKEKEPPKEKEEIKEEKNDNKKDNKKKAKVQDKKLPEEPVKIEQPPKPVKKELTEDDFRTVRLSLKITNLEEHLGTIFDSSVFPAESEPLKMQTSYWVKYDWMGEVGEGKDKIIGFENTLSQNNEVRLSLGLEINREFSVNQANYRLFNQGLKLYVMKREPKMIKDLETGELKPELKDSQIEVVQQVMGATYIDFRGLHLLKQKNIKQKFRLFPAEAVNSPLFSDPYEDLEERIDKKKQSYEKQLKAFEQEAQRKAQQEEQKQAQKKGKDSKKADKKAAKKDGKEAVVQKVKSQACGFPIFDRLYSLTEGDKMSKGKELLCVDVIVE